MTKIFLFFKATPFKFKSAINPKPSVVSPKNLPFFIDIVFTDFVCWDLSDNSSQTSHAKFFNGSVIFKPAYPASFNSFKVFLKFLPSTSMRWYSI